MLNPETGVCDMRSLGEGKRRVEWIDLAKFFAIIAVMIDHTARQLQFTKGVKFFSYYSVGVFILMMGIVSFWSYGRSSVPGLKKACRSCWSILRPYIVATFVYYMFCHGGGIIFDKIIINLIRFNASGPFYYVLLYVQLALVAPLVYRILSAIGTIRNSALRNVLDLLFMILVLGVSWLTTNYTNVLGVFGGGGRLLGGTFFFLFCTGMWFGRRINGNFVFGNAWALIGLLAVGILATGAWWQFMLENKDKLDVYCHIGRALNPPGICFGLYAILVSITLFLLGNLLDRIPAGNVFRRVYGFMTFLGRHTLYIFLYHRLFIDFIFGWLFTVTGIAIGNIWLKRLLYFTGMIGGSLAIEFAFKWLHGIVVRAYFQAGPCDKTCHGGLPKTEQVSVS